MALPFPASLTPWRLSPFNAASAAGGSLIRRQSFSCQRIHCWPGSHDPPPGLPHPPTLPLVYTSPEYLYRVRPLPTFIPHWQRSPTMLEVPPMLSQENFLLYATISGELGERDFNPRVADALAKALKLITSAPRRPNAFQLARKRILRYAN